MHAGRAGEPLETLEARVGIDHLAALVRWPEHDHPAESLDITVFQVLADQDAAHRVGHEVDGAGLADVSRSLLILTAMTVVFIVGGTWLFRWRLE